MRCSTHNTRFVTAPQVDIPTEIGPHSGPILNQGVQERLACTLALASSYLNKENSHD